MWKEMMQPTGCMERLENQAQKAGGSHGGYPGTMWSGRDLAPRPLAACLC